jgi:WD40 repeat protein
MPLENLHPITGTIGVVGTVVGILAGTFQLVDQIEKRSARLSKRQQSQSDNTQEESLPEPSETKTKDVADATTVRQDWGEAVDVSVFYGRTEELLLLEQWVLQDDCRLIALLGMGGMGKTSLSIKLAQQIIQKGNFEFVIWRSLGNAPPLQDILADLIKFFSQEQEADLPQEISTRISLFIEYLKTSRCLLILDNFESILTEGDKAGEYRDSYEDYGEFIKIIGRVAHKSCLIITSREKPKEFAVLEGETQPIRALQLNGLKSRDGEVIFQERGLVGDGDERIRLIDFYQGNPLALKIISTTIKELFDGSITDFLGQNLIVFGGIRELLEGQFNRLSDLEQEVMYWLAINREPVTIAELRDDIISQTQAPKIIEVLESLLRRSLIEKGRDSNSSKAIFTLQNVVMEYMTDKLIEQVSAEINQGIFALFNSHLLIKATANDYIRLSQIRLIVKPILNRFTSEQKRNGEFLLQKLRNQTEISPGYAAGNIINLLVQLKIDLTGYNFSGLIIKQAYLQGVNLQQVNFAEAEIDKSIFTQTFGTIQTVAFSPDGKIFAAGDANGQILLWQLVDGKQILSCKAHQNWIWSIAFSPVSDDPTIGGTIASGSSDQTVRLCNILQGKSTQSLEKHTNEVRSVVFSPDSKILASSSSDQTIRLWDVRTGECLKTLQGHTNVVRQIAFSPNGKILASSSHDQTICLWDVEKGVCLKILEGHSNQVRSVSFSEDGNTIASGSDDQTIRLWNVNTGKCLKIIHGHLNQVRSLTYSHDGKILASAGRDQTIKLWDVTSGKYLKILRGHTQSVESIAFSPDNSHLVSGGYDQTVRLWDVAAGRCLKTLQGYANWVWSVAFSPDGKILASGSDDFAVRLWDISTGECLQTFRKHTSRVWCVTYSSDGKILASSSDDKTIRLWDIETGECLKIIRKNTYHIKSICFNHDASILASTSADETIRLWNTANGECIKTLEGHTRRVQSVTFSLDGKILASGSDDGTIKLWDISTGKCVTTLQGHNAEVTSVKFSPDGRFIVSGSHDQTVCLWNVSKGELSKTLQAHTDFVESVAFSPDGKIILSSSSDQTVRLWNVRTGKEIKTLTTHLGAVWSVTMSPNGATIASGSQDETIKLWDGKTGECFNTLRAQRPYEGMNISGIMGLTEAEKATLKALGAFS